MLNILKPFGAKGIGSFSRRFQLSLFKLTAMYVAILAAILLLSSSITYSAFSNRLEHRFANFHPPTITIQGNTVSVVEQPPRPDDVRSDLIYSLIIVNGLLLILAGGLSYLLAVLTLDPIKQAYERQRAFLGDASHELRTPLAILQTDLENDLSDKTLPAVVREHAESNLEEVGRMSRLVNDLLMLSRLDEAGEIHTRGVATLAVPELVSTILKRLEPVAEKHLVKLEFPQLEQIDSIEFTTATNEDLLSQALTNVIKNAILYNHAQGTVTISLESIKREIRIFVKDTGVGVSSQEIAKLFDRFYRSDASRSRNTGGSGLGLAIVHSSMKQLGGSVHMTSEVDKGTTVIMHIPRR